MTPNKYYVMKYIHFSRTIGLVTLVLASLHSMCGDIGLLQMLAERSSDEKYF